ncbi:hypothetical protein BLA29_008426, partial [Euroglyphus maynei]
VARKRIRHKPGNKVSLIALKSATSKTGQISNVKNVPINQHDNNYLPSSAKRLKTRFNIRKKLAKYSTAEYLQEHNRPTSDIVSQNVDLCVDESIDSQELCISANTMTAENHKKFQQLKLPPSINQNISNNNNNRSSSSSSTPTEENFNHDKKLSITSTAKTTTTTTHLTMTSYESSTDPELSTKS